MATGAVHDEFFPFHEPFGLLEKSQAFFDLFRFGFGVGGSFPFVPQLLAEECALGWKREWGGGKGGGGGGGGGCWC